MRLCRVCTSIWRWRYCQLRISEPPNHAFDFDCCGHVLLNALHFAECDRKLRGCRKIPTLNVRLKPRHTGHRIFDVLALLFRPRELDRCHPIITTNGSAQSKSTLRIEYHLMRIDRKYGRLFRVAHHKASCLSSSSAPTKVSRKIII